MTDAARQRLFRELYDAHVRSLLGYALRRVDNAEDAADVVADTFLVAWRRIVDVPAGGEARLWLYGVARRVLANNRRGAVRRQRLSERLRAELAAIQPDPLGMTETTQLVRAALMQLDEDDRELVQLTAWEGLTPTEIARTLEIPAPTVRSRLFRARERLRATLRDMDRERFRPAGHVSDNGRPLVPKIEDPP